MAASAVIAALAMCPMMAAGIAGFRAVATVALCGRCRASATVVSSRISSGTGRTALWVAATASAPPVAEFRARLGLVEA